MLTEERTTATDGPTAATAGMPSKSRDAYNSRNTRNVENTSIRRDVTAIGTAATAETLPPAGTPRMPTAVKTAAVAGTPAVAQI
jgi:hypothetical protein